VQIPGFGRKETATSRLTPENVIEQSVRQFVERYGDKAADQARLRAIELKSAGNEDGYATWMEIYTEIVTRRGSQTSSMQ